LNNIGKLIIVNILVIMLFITTVFTSLGLESNAQGNNINLSSIELEDQHNSPEHIDASYGMPLYQGWCSAQRFTPTKQSLSKVSLMIGKYGNPPANSIITVSIRNSLNGDTLTSKQVDMDTISTSKVDFDFPDIDVIPGNQYYIICSIDRHNQHGPYYWSFTVNDKYKNGDSWLSNNCQTWYNAEDLFIQFDGIDFGFTTYWIDYAPDNPEINGPIEAKAQEFTNYTFYTTDPEGHNVRYYIEWGDGFDFKWIGPYESGEIVTKGHSWASEGNYTIRVKARDIYGAECDDWTELEVIMPKTKATNTPFLTFLENYPHLFPLLHLILGL